MITTTLVVVIMLIAIKGPTGDQPGIVGSVVRHYTEETSASIIPTETKLQLTDISSLMGNNVPATNRGQGGSEDYISSTVYLIQDDSVQAVNSVSVNYLDDIKPNKITNYTVLPGDALSFIASDFGVSTESIIWANKLTDINNISPGQILRIPPISGVIHSVQKGDSVSSIAKKYNADSARIIAFNELGDDSKLVSGTDLVIPDGEMTKATAGSKTSVKYGATSSVAKKFAYLPDMGDYFGIPATGFDWGIVHGRNSVDVANACGTPIKASANGTVVIALSSGWNGGFGKYIKLVHSNGTETLYGHLSKLLITEGEVAAKGQEIGLMGTTGNSTGCHLHFEVHGARNILAKY